MFSLLSTTKVERERDWGRCHRERERLASMFCERDLFGKMFWVKEGENYGSLKGQFRLTDWKRRVGILSSHRPSTWKPPCYSTMSSFVQFPFLHLSFYYGQFYFRNWICLLKFKKFLYTNFRGQKSGNPLKICLVITTLLFVQNTKKNALHLQVHYFHF